MCVIDGLEGKGIVIPDGYAICKETDLQDILKAATAVVEWEDFDQGDPEYFEHELELAVGRFEYVDAEGLKHL